MQRRIIIFTRYPEPRKTKTRLIPALGPQRAADLGREMTHHTLGVVAQVPARLSAASEVCFEGGNAEKIAACFGSGAVYRPQCAGNLGCRMQHAFAQAFSEGTRQTVIIGTDCPGITPELLAEAFHRLVTSDLVLGPASDGGYYLVGLRRPTPQLFTDIPWGSDRVLDETLRRAGELSLNVSLLKVLSDVDRPEDLAVWHRTRRRWGPSATRISVIIPTLNEANHLPQALASLRDTRNVETIVVDGGSDDGTREIAAGSGCRLLRSPPGRALQLSVGARAASGGVLLFLHADTRLPPGFDAAVRATLEKPGVVAGAFRLRIDALGWPFRIIERAADLRSRLLQMPYGDQSVFVSKGVFHEVGGFPEFPIMEDLEFVRRLRRRGRIRITSLAVMTSGRRWLELGPWRTTWINQKVILGYYLGVSPNRLVAWYRAGNDT